MKMLRKISSMDLLTASISFCFTQTAFAISESELQAQVEAAGKEAVSGNVLIWFLCAIAFLKVSQKIDSFLSSLGIHVGNTGGSMLAEAMIAAKGIGGIRNFSSHYFGGGRSNSSTHMNAGGGRNGANGASGSSGVFLAGGIGRHMYASSVSKGGGFANNVIGTVATGSLAAAGSITGEKAAEALHSYMGFAALEEGAEHIPSFSNVEIGGGRITGTETSEEHPEGIAFSMYHTDQYMAPEGAYTTVHAAEAGKFAVHTLRGAVKSGKAVSGAAKGAAAGPYGAAAGALWSERKTVGKILAAAGVLLLLPILFLLLLPGLIFGGLTESRSAFDSNTPILNSETAIMENCNEISFSINAVLGEGVDDVLKRIEEDFSASDGDQMEVINPYETNPVYNANLFVSQYCAYKDSDFKSISISDMADIMRKNKQHLYSYRRTEELREETEIDPETGKETTTTEKWMIYTILYNGESYFADQVFSLSDEQKMLADNYAQNLSLFLGDGMLQSLTEWTGNSIPSLGDVRFSDGGTEVEGR